MFSAYVCGGPTIKNGIDDFMQQLATQVNLYVLDHGAT